MIKKKIFLTSCSKITYIFKSLLILDSEYNIREINDKWRMKNIIIRDSSLECLITINFSLENKLRKLIKDLIPESIVVNSKYVKFVSNNTSIKLFHNEKIIRKLVSHGYYYLSMKIMLNNDGSIENINDQFMESSKCGYLGVVELLINLGADICVNDNRAISMASYYGHSSVVKLLTKLGANINTRTIKMEYFLNTNRNRSWETPE